MLLNQIVFARKNSGGGILLNYKQLNILYKTHIYALYNRAKKIDKRQKNRKRNSSQVPQPTQQNAQQNLLPQLAVNSSNRYTRSGRLQTTAIRDMA